MSFTPIGPRVVVRPQAAAEKTAGGLFLANSVQEPKGEVVAVGAGEYQNGVLVPMSVGIGQQVQYARGAGAEIIVDGEKLLIMLERDILGIL